MDDSSIKNFVEFVKKENIKIDILINNAGVGTEISYWKDKNPEEIMKTILNTNYRGTIKLTAYTIPFLSSGAKVINISS